MKLKNEKGRNGRGGKEMQEEVKRGTNQGEATTCHLGQDIRRHGKLEVEDKVWGLGGAVKVIWGVNEGGWGEVREGGRRSLTSYERERKRERGSIRVLLLVIGCKKIKKGKSEYGSVTPWERDAGR